MDIAALSMQMSMANVQQQASVSVLKKAMDNTENQMSALLEGMPPSNHRLDTYA